jgi:hypothetical protein
MGNPMRPMPIQPMFCSFFAIASLLRGFRACCSGGFMTGTKALQQRRLVSPLPGKEGGAQRAPEAAP